DGLLKGHPYVKSALDIAMWDILGQTAGLPLYVLLGGRHGQSIPLYQPISHDVPDRMAAQVKAAQEAGYARFQPKVGANPDDDIARLRAVLTVTRPGDVVVADANGGWFTHQARRFVGAMAGAPIYVEQPCAGYDECLSIRAASALPFVLDESIDSAAMVLRLQRDHAADLINLKLAKVGGLTPARQIRDLCVSLGIAMTIEDSGGGDVIAAAITHLAQATPVANRYALCNAYFLVKRHFADGVPEIRDGAVTATDAPGLGLRLREQELGKPFFSTH
ncbi:MAG: mandelate racemase, partial [Alphaproteobacteria bacterium]|nr:mandelate racemase [Alphaproteobacteria bacterium]